METYRFGPFELDADKNLLQRGDELVALTPKAFDLLLLLVRRGGRVVPKDEILRVVWPGTEFVEEWNLTQLVYGLRIALGDKKKQSEFIETVPRRGYRFVARVEEPGRATAVPTPGGETQPDPFRLTMRRGAVFRARFAPDGETVLYGAAFGGGPGDVYLTTLGGEAAGSRSLGLKNAGLFSVSSSGELAVALGERPVRGYIRAGGLAVTSLTGGGAPREMLAGVHEADHSPSGELAVVREEAGLVRLEYPAGRVLYETAGWVSHPRFSRDGQRLAFIDHPLQNDDRGAIAVVDLAHGKPRLVSVEWLSAQGLAWSPSGEEVWFTATMRGNHRALCAVTMDGRQRVLLRQAGALTLQDVTPAGRVLFVKQNTRIGVMCRPPGEAGERDLSWLDWSLARDLSADGKVLLFTEAGEGGGANYGVYLRDTGGGDAERLGDGSALALSPDGRWALCRNNTPPLRMTLLPVPRGSGEPRELERAPLLYQQWGGWTPDGREVIFTACEPGRGSQLFIQSVGGGAPRCVTPEEEGVHLTTPNAVSPDGRGVAAVGADGVARIYGPGGGRSDIPGAEVGDAPIRWDAGGHNLYVYKRGVLPLRVEKLELASGGRVVLMELMPPDPAGVVEVLRVLLTPDGESYAYTYTRDLSDLYLVNGVR
jgi:DNA-binding winged helix-turn-helix (wHTH) protein/Tol biopolymer transport system component